MTLQELRDVVWREYAEARSQLSSLEEKEDDSEDICDAICLLDQKIYKLDTILDFLESVIRVKDICSNPKKI